MRRLSAVCAAARLASLLVCALIVIACGQGERPTPLGPPLSDVLPPCSEAVKIADEDVYRDENPFKDLADEPGFQEKPMKAKWAEGTGIQAQYVRGCGDVDSSLVRTDVYEFANEESARAYVLSQEGVYACHGSEFWGCYSVFQSAIDPDKHRTDLDEALQGFIRRVPAVFVGMYSNVENVGADQKEDWAYEEGWLVLWPQGRYVVQVDAELRVRDFTVTGGGRTGVVAAHPFDSEHMAGSLSLEILDRWPDVLDRQSRGAT